jgi:hypothetical protein
VGLFDEIRRALEEAMTEQQTTAMPGRTTPRQAPPAAKTAEKPAPKREPPRPSTPPAAPVKHVPSAAGKVSQRTPSKQVELHKALSERQGLRQAIVLKEILDRPRSLNPWRGR